MNEKIASARCVVSAASAILEQCAGLAERIDDGVYTAASKRLAGGTIGKHLRHVVDHFRAAVEGCEATIDYDHRERQVPMETNRRAALDEVRHVAARMEGLAEEVLERPVRIRVMVSGDGTETELSSSLARELHFAMHHAIHHQAMMRSIAEEFGAALSPEFGMAPSTLNHERARA